MAWDSTRENSSFDFSEPRRRRLKHVKLWTLTILTAVLIVLVLSLAVHFTTARGKTNYAAG